MEKRVLICVCVSLSILGIALIAFARPEVSPQILELNGTINEIKVRSNVEFISFVPNNLEVVSFGTTGLMEGNATLRGRLQQYKGRLEFVLYD